MTLSPLSFLQYVMPSTASRVVFVLYWNTIRHYAPHPQGPSLIIGYRTQNITHTNFMNTQGSTARTRQLALAMALTCAAVSGAFAGDGNAMQYTASAKTDRQGVVRSFYNLSVATPATTPEVAARNFVASHARELGMQNGSVTLATERTATVPGGMHVRMIQTHRGIPVYGAGVVVTTNASHKVTMVSNTTIADLEVANAPAFDATRAITLARTALKTGARSIGTPDAATLVVFRAADGSDHLAYRVTLTREEPAGDWELLVDAESGSVLQQMDMFVDYHEGERVQGAGFVYQTDPLSASRHAYGTTGFTDANDAASDSLNACRSFVALDSVTYSGGQFILQGPYCSIVDIESPIDTAIAVATPDGFTFTRAQGGFEAVNAFYHVTASYRRLEELGFSSSQLAALRVDPHGFQGQDNSHYSPTGNWLSFGTGGVDDAEDADVIWHEYGHAIQYTFAPGWGGGECAALGEGYADYWAASFSRSSGKWTSNDAQFNWVYKWDGHNEFWAGRKLNDQRTYPFGTLSAHSAGQIWSSALMSIWNDLGRDVTDHLVVKSLFYLGAGSTAVDAAQAMLQADRDLYEGVHIAKLVYWLGSVKHFIDPSVTEGSSTDVADNASTPQTFALHQNYPNPFNPTTAIAFSLASSAHVRLSIYNVLGQEIAVVADAEFAAGAHTTTWDASNLSGVAVGSSMYIARLTVVPVSGGDPMNFTRKMVLMR
jgi:zinc metalloprotease ZmpB